MNGPGRGEDFLAGVPPLPFLFLLSYYLVSLYYPKKKNHEVCELGSPATFMV